MKQPPDKEHPVNIPLALYDDDESPVVSITGDEEPNDSIRDPYDFEWNDWD